MRNLQNIAVRNQVLLEQYKRGQVDLTVRQINKIEKQLSKLLGALPVDTGNQLTKKELNSLLMESRAIQKGIHDEMFNEQLEAMSELSRFSVDSESEQLNKLIKTADGKFKASVPAYEKAFRKALNTPIQATGTLMETFTKDWSVREIKRVNQKITQGWTSGATVQEMVQSIRGTRALNYKDGVMSTTKRTAEAVVRTSTQHVASTSRNTVWNSNKDVVTGYEWVSTLDGKTSDTCRSLDGRVFEVDKGPMPPVHINCRSTTAPKLVPELDFLDEGATRSSSTGPVSAKESYYDWLKNQPVEFQDNVLGKGKGELFRKNGVEWYEKNSIGKTFQPLTLEQMEKLDPNTKPVKT